MGLYRTVVGREASSWYHQVRLHRQRRFRFTAAVLFAFLLMATGASLGARAQRPKSSRPADKTSLTKKLNANQRKSSRLKKQLRTVKLKQRRVAGQLKVIDAHLNRTEAKLRQTKRNVAQAQVELNHASNLLDAAKKQLRRHRNNLAKRLVAIYQQGEARPIHVLLASTSFNDFTNQLYQLDRVVDQDANLLSDYQEAQEQANERRDVVKEKERRLTQLKEQVVTEKLQTEEARRAKASEDRQLRIDRAAYERKLAELEQNSREITAMLRRLQQTSEGHARMISPWRGGLQKPVNGRLTSGYGYRTHPIFGTRRMHTGIDIAASSGTPIHAAAGGEVVFAGRWGGYGNCVIIDHGGGLATLYAHCSRLGVSAGRKVKQGQTIAYVGSTGLSIGPHLHFEVRKNGQHVDPMGSL